MFISRVRLKSDPSAGSLFALLSGRLGAYEAHRLIWTLFGDAPDRKRDFLFRQDGRGAAVEYTVVSRARPEDRHNLFCVDTKDYAPDLRAGDRLDFLARVNPTIKKDGRRVDVVMDRIHPLPKKDRPNRQEVAQAAVPEWLAARGAANGFSLEDDPATVVPQYEVERFRTRGGDDARLAVADLRGRLTVTDPEAFTAMLFNGLGPGKGFGLGLVLVRRAA